MSAETDGASERCMGFVFDAGLDGRRGMGSVVVRESVRRASERVDFSLIVGTGFVFEIEVEGFEGEEETWMGERPQRRVSLFVAVAVLTVAPPVPDPTQPVSWIESLLARALAVLTADVVHPDMLHTTLPRA